MKNLRIYAAFGILAAFGLILIAADHSEAPNVTGSTSDVADLWAFEGENPENTVFVATVQGLLTPSGTADAQFDENVLIEFNIDNDGDLVEDLVIQAIPFNGEMFFFGPYAPETTGLNSTIDLNAEFQASVQISSGTNALIETANGISYFAGPREDPFFFDFNQFNQIVAGNAPGGFIAPGGNDDFANTNVLAVVVEVPNSLLGSTFAHPAGTNTQVFNVWAESKRRN